MIPILETRILLHTLINIPFLNENEGTLILKDLANCIENNWYSKEDTWNYKIIINELKRLQKLILYDYLIYGSLVVYNDNYIKWELQTAILSKINKYVIIRRERRDEKLQMKALGRSLQW
ncbi:MAG: hypothetical protein ACFE9C_08365 [Candidatus Hodarchaeota archaeon]